MTSGLYGYYDIEKEYVVYIGKDSHIYRDRRHKDHTNPEKYDEQVINRVVQKNPDRYTYFRFIEGDYDTQTLNALEREAIRIFKTYKYDYPEKNVFNFNRGGEGFDAGQDHPCWRDKNYQTVKTGKTRGKQRYCILGRYGNVIKFSTNKKRLEELTNKLNTKEITEKEIENLRLYSIKERQKKATQAHIKYDIWDVSCCYYSKRDMLICNGGDKPRKCFKYKYKGRQIPIGYFHDFITCQILNSIIEEEVKKCKHEN